MTKRRAKSGDVRPSRVALKTAAADVMSWADPDFAYDHLAITRNFVGSPHVDREDTSHQYALALVRKEPIVFRSRPLASFHNPDLFQ